MENNTNNPLHKIQYKITQIKSVYQALFAKPLTIIEDFSQAVFFREYIFRCSRKLDLSGKLFFVNKEECCITGNYVKVFVTKNDYQAEFSKQLKFF